jgi:hypothetical protein
MFLRGIILSSVVVLGLTVAPGLARANVATKYPAARSCQLVPLATAAT